MAKDIENPCISVCQLNSELCLSCGRTKEDIRKWKRMKRPEKMAAVQRATLRLKSLQKKTIIERRSLGHSCTASSLAAVLGPLTTSSSA